MTTVITPGMLLEQSRGPTKTTLLRVLDVLEETEQVYLLKASKSPPRRSRVPACVSLVLIEMSLGHGLTIVSDTVREPQMEWPDKDLPAAAVKVRDRRLKVLGPLVATKEMRRAILAKESRAGLVAQRAQEAQVSCAEIRLLLTIFWNYGCTNQALLGHSWSQGGAGKRRKAGKTKLGRPNVFAVSNPNSPDKGVNAEPHFPKFRKALEECWVGKNSSLHDAYIWMVENCYARKGRGRDGIERDYQTNGRYIPTEAQFRYWAPTFISESGMFKQKVGEADWDDIHRKSFGSSSDLVRYPGELYDLDGTGSKAELVRKTNRADRVGRATVLFAVDRGSDAIVGISLSLHPESWDLYRHCLFSACTPKDRLLRKLGLPQDCWPIHAVPAGIYVDRGPGNSDAAADAAIDELKLRRATAPPHKPRAKGHVEGMNSKAHRWVASHRGAYMRTKRGARMQEKRKSARKDAVQSCLDVLRLYVLFASHHNKTTHVPHLLTAEMRNDPEPVRPVPEEIFLWGLKQRRGGENRHLTESEIYLKLLRTEKERAVYPEGIKDHAAVYSSTTLLDWREQQIQQNLGRSTPKITVAYDPVDPLIRYWIRPSGQIEQLVANEQTKRLYGNATIDEVQNEYQVEDRKNAIISGRSRANLTKKQSGELDDIASHKLTWVAQSKVPIGVSRSEETRLNDIELRQESRRQMMPLIGEQEVEPLSRTEDIDGLVLEGDDRLVLEGDDRPGLENDNRILLEGDDGLVLEDDETTASTRRSSVLKDGERKSHSFDTIFRALIDGRTD
jgi:hypothetical protein